MPNKSKSKKSSTAKTSGKALTQQTLVPGKKVRNDSTKTMEKSPSGGSAAPEGNRSFIPTSVADSELVYHEIIDDVWTLDRLATYCSMYRSTALRAAKATTTKNPVYGNPLFQQWNKHPDYGHLWAFCERYDARFSDLSAPIKFSWEQAFNQVVVDHRKNWVRLEQKIRLAFDMSLLAEQMYSSEENALWVVRHLVMGLVSQDPATIFDLQSPASTGSSSSRYWDFSDPSNPRLLVDTRPLAKFWVMGCEIMGWPWVDPSITQIPDLVKKFQSSSANEDSLSAAERKRRRAQGEAVAEETQKDGPRVQPITPARGGFISPPLKPVQEPASSSLSATPNPSTEQPQSLPASSEGSSPSTSGKTAPSPSTLVAQAHTQAPAPAPAPSLFPSRSETPATPAQDGTSLPAAVANSEITVTKVVSPVEGGSVGDGTSSSDVVLLNGETSPPPMGEIMVSKPRAQSSAQKKLHFDLRSQDARGPSSQLSVRQQFLSEAEKAKAVRQVDMKGIPLRHSRFVCLSYAWNWDGDEAETGKVQDRGAAVLVEILKQALEQMPNDLMFLPISDRQFSKKELWIKSPSDLDKIDSFDKLRRYVDLNWNNGHTIPCSGKGPGVKIFRTRMLFAFDSEPEVVEAPIHDMLAETGFNMGLYRSPLQVGNALKIGWLMNYPTGVNKELLERELMRHFDFQIPIALDVAYPSKPGAFGKAFVRGGRRALHLVVPNAMACTVYNRMSSLLTKYTPKPEMPFGASTQFVVDWRAVRSKKLGLDEDDDLAEVISKAINTHENHGDTTALVHPGYPMYMLTQSTVRHFEDENLSLLCLLYSIQCSPHQADKAEESKAADQSDASQVQGEKNSVIVLPEDSSPATADTHMGESSQSDDTGATPSSSPAAPADLTSPPRLQLLAGTSGSSGKAPSGGLLPPVIPRPSSAPVAPSGLSGVKIKASEVRGETLEERRARLNKKDLENFIPSPLFQMILPARAPHQFVFVVREKFRQLAKNVLRGLAAFLTYHLELADDPRYQRKLLRSWLCKRHIDRINRYGMVWDPKTLQVQSKFDRTNSMMVDENDEWLEALDGDKAVRERFMGTLSFNLQLASLQGLDEGSTVASRLNEILRLKQVEEEYKQALAELDEKDVQLADRDARLAAQRDEILAMRALLAAHGPLPGDNTHELHNDTIARADPGGGPTGEGS